jgi:hypothetical protein
MMLMSGGGGDVPKRAKEKRRGWEKRRVYIHGSRRMRLCSLNLAALRPQGLGSEVVSCYERPNPKSTRSEDTVSPRWHPAGPSHTQAGYIWSLQLDIKHRML